MTNLTQPQTPHPVDVTTAKQALELAEQILKRRTMPLVLVSTNSGGDFGFDLKLLRAELDGVAEVITILSGHATDTLGVAMPDGTHVFGGAARSYPPLFALSPTQEDSRLRFPQYATEQDLIDDAAAVAPSSRD